MTPNKRHSLIFPMSRLKKKLDQLHIKFLGIYVKRSNVYYNNWFSYMYVFLNDTHIHVCIVIIFFLLLSFHEKLLFIILTYILKVVFLLSVRCFYDHLRKFYSHLSCLRYNTFWNCVATGNFIPSHKYHLGTIRTFFIFKIHPMEIFMTLII